MGKRMWICVFLGYLNLCFYNFSEMSDRPIKGWYNRSFKILSLITYWSYSWLLPTLMWEVAMFRFPARRRQVHLGLLSVCVPKLPFQKCIHSLWIRSKSLLPKVKHFFRLRPSLSQTLYWLLTKLLCITVFKTIFKLIFSKTALYFRQFLNQILLEEKN